MVDVTKSQSMTHARKAYHQTHVLHILLYIYIIILTHIIKYMFKAGMTAANKQHTTYPT
jgi:hypothetical protein